MVPTLLRKTLGRIILCCLTAAAPPACVKLPRRADGGGSQPTHAQQTRQETPLISINEASREEFALREADIRDRAALDEVFQETRFDVVVHLAARAGVRPSLAEPGMMLQPERLQPNMLAFKNKHKNQ